MSIPALDIALCSIVLAQSTEAAGSPTTTGPAAPLKPSFKDSLTHIPTDTSDLAAWLGRIAAEFGLRIVGVILVLVAAWMFSAWARKALYRALNRPQFDQTLIRFLSNAIRWAILLLGFVAALTLFGVAPASLAAVVGATGLAIGLAMQGSLSNLAAGIMLLLLRPFRVGDLINVAGQLGKVDDIELFHTKLDTLDNRRVIVPNGQIFGSVIENITHNPQRRIDITVGVEYAADIDATRTALLKAIQSVRGVLPDPAPEAALTGLGNSSVEWQLRLWCRTTDFGAVRQTAIRAAKVALDEAGISIPFPQMDVWARGEPRPPRPLADVSLSRLRLLPPDWPTPTNSEPDPE